MAGLMVLYKGRARLFGLPKVAEAIGDSRQRISALSKEQLQVTLNRADIASEQAL
jgi:hypothetical protein